MKKIIGLITAGALAVLVLGSTGCTYATPNPGDIGVVRNGGPFDNKQIRGLDEQGNPTGDSIVSAGDSRRYVGWSSSVHWYPNANVQRYYKIDNEDDRADRQRVVRVQTKDGYFLNVEGTFYFTTAFDGTAKGNELLVEFDNQFGAREFPELAKDGNGSAHPWEGAKGWGAFLGAAVDPLIDNEMREAFLEFDCSQVVASCSLIASRTQVTNAPPKVGSVTNLEAVQDRIADGVHDRIGENLGQAYFDKVSFAMKQPVLDAEVASAIRKAQAAFALVAESQAKIQTAENENLANLKKQAVYESCPACAQIDALKVLPQGTSVFFGVTPSVTVGRRAG